MKPLNVQTVREAIGDRIPKLTLRWVEQTGSTNADLASLADSGAGDWTVLVADRQTSGRGRHDRTWSSPIGGLYVSILLKLEESSSPVTLIPLAVGLALHRSLMKLATEKGQELDLRLKWPNDVLTPTGKLAGILCESSVTGNRWRVIAGVGVNLAATPGIPTAGIDPPATSLDVETDGTAWSREEVLAAFLIDLRAALNLWVRDPERLRGDWTSAARLAGREMTVKTSLGPVTGTALGIRPSGALILKTSDGEIEIHAAEGIEER